MNSGFHERFCDALVAWDSYERAREDGVPPIDSNYIGHETGLRFDNRADARAAFVKLYNESAGLGEGASRARIRGFLGFMDASDDIGRFSLSAYFARMTGIRLTYVPEATMQAAKNRLEAALRPLSVPLSECDEGLQAAEPACEGPVFEVFVRERINADLPVLRAMAGIDEGGFSYDVHVVNDQKVMWRGWIAGDSNLNFTLKFNEARLGKLTRSGLVSTVRHELLGHGVLDTLRTRRALAGELPKSAGIFTCAGYELLQSEAIADAVPLLFEPSNPLEGAWRRFHDYRRMVANNMYVLSETHGQKEAVAYFNERSPLNYVRDDIAEKLLGVVGKSPVWRFYNPLYGPARQVFTEVAQTLGPKKFGAFLGEIYPEWLDARGLNRVIHKYTQGKGGFQLAL